MQEGDHDNRRIGWKQIALDHDHGGLAIHRDVEAA